MAEEALTRLKNEVQAELTITAIGLAAGALLGLASTKLPARDASKLREAAKEAMPVPKAPGGAGAAAEGGAAGVESGGLSRLRSRPPGDIEPPLPGETPAQYCDRTRGDSPALSELPEPARKANIESAERQMAKARLQLQLRDPEATWTHYTSSGGYDSIMRGEQLRAGGGQQGLGQGEGVRAMPGPFNNAAPAKSGNVYFDFQVPSPPVPGYVTRYSLMGDGAMWPMPAGDMLPVRITRVGYPNGASAFRTGGGKWRLTAPTGETAELTLEELLSLGRQPVVPQGAK